MSSVENPYHRVADDVAMSFRKINEAEMKVQKYQDETDRVSRLTWEERNEFAQIRASVLEANGLNREMQQRIGLINKARFRRFKDLIVNQAETGVVFKRPQWDIHVMEPEQSDPSFWWANTQWWHSSRTPPAPDQGSAASFNAELEEDGLHFRGGVTTHNGDLYKDSFGAVALFELQSNRIPDSPSGRFRSTPHIELFGGLHGYTGDDDIFTGDLWSKCWMQRDQRIFQFGFGPSGPEPIIRGQAHESETLIFEENKNRPIHVGLRGFQWMPPVTFGDISPGDSLWARLEIRFDIQTEGAGTLLWLNPEVLLRTFQWKLIPL